MTALVIARFAQRTVVVSLTALVALTFTLWASPAQAHAELVSSTPAEGASVSKVAEFSLTFGEEMTPEFSTFTLTDSTKTAVKLGTPRYDATKMTATVPLAQMVGGGEYTIGYSVLSVDGHTVAGTIHFTSTAPIMAGPGHEGKHSGPPPSGMPLGHDHDRFGPDADDDDSGKAIWFAVGGALLGAAIVAVIAWLIRRRGLASAERATESGTNDAAPSDDTASAVKLAQDKPKRTRKSNEG